MITQFSGAGSTLRDYIQLKDVYPVGRLDHDSEGLLLLTDDGALQHRLTTPKFAHFRTYWVQVEGQPDSRSLRELADGVLVQGIPTRPAKVKLLDEEPSLPPRNPPIRFRKTVPTAWIEITLTEGRNRQVRRMTAAVGYPTLRLVRIAMGDLRLEGLLPGEWRNLSDSEIALMRKIAGRPIKPQIERQTGLQAENRRTKPASSRRRGH